MRARRALALATIAVGALALGGCAERAELGEPILAVGGAARPQPVPEQTVGTCYAVTSVAEANPETLYDTPVPCDGPKATAITYLVGELDPADVVGEAKSVALPQCQDALPKALGVSAEQADVSAVTAIAVVPNLTDFAKGVRTFRCDLTVNTDATLTLPATSLPIFPDGDLPDSARWCVATPSSGGQTTYVRVTCDNDNSVYRAVGSARFPEPFVAEDPRSNYPDDAAQKDFAEQQCLKYADDDQIADFAAPSEAEWGWGSRRLVCFVADKKDL